MNADEYKGARESLDRMTNAVYRLADALGKAGNAIIDWICACSNFLRCYTTEGVIQYSIEQYKGPKRVVHLYLNSKSKRVRKKNLKRIYKGR